MHLRGFSSHTWALACYKVAKAGHYLIKTRQHCLGSFMAESRSLNDCAVFCTKASQVRAQLGDQSRSGILRVIIGKLPKPDERFSNDKTYWKIILIT